ncbi:tight junction protein ZO-1 [Tachysurus ichikawai]
MMARVLGVASVRRQMVPPSSDAAASSGAVPPGASASQGKPSLRRIKGRVHRSKSLDSIDLLDCNVSRQITFKRRHRRAIRT